MGTGDITAHIPQIRPHYQRRDRKFYFMISRRPLLELAPDEVSLYESIDGRRTVGDLETLHPGAQDRLIAWREAAILELIPPLTSPASPHLVVIEPHMDDAALSVGGRLLHRRGKCRITILSAVKWSNFTSYLLLKRNILNVRQVTELRLQESALVARFLGAEHRCLDWTDAPLRFWPGELWSSATVDRFNKFPKVFVNLIPDPKEVSQLAEQLMEQLNVLAPDELWIPMGLGDHVDHRTTRSACLQVLSEARHRFKGVPVAMYEDVPYATNVGNAARISSVLASGGTRLVCATEDITDVFKEKLRLISLYASQFKLSHIEPAVRGLADRAGGGTGKLAETYHRVEGEVRRPLESRLAREWAGLATLQKGMSALLPKRTEWRRLTVIALPSTHLGVWRTNRELLLSAFPNADLHLYAPEEMAWQTEQGGIEKCKLEIVRESWRGWIAVNRREFFRFRTPTIFLWRNAYGAGLQSKRPRLINALAKMINLLVKTLLPFRQVLFARSLADFCGVLDEQLGGDQAWPGSS